MFAGSRGVGKRTSIYPSELRGLFTAKLVTKVSRFRLGTNLPDVMEAVTKFALRSVACRHQNGSPKKSPSSASNWIVWWPKPRRSRSP